MKKISMFAAALVMAVLSFATSVSADNATTKAADCCPGACCVDGGACCE